MSTARPYSPCLIAAAARAGGFALATCLLLLTVFAILAIAGFTAALIEQRIAANLEQRERAFQAAEYGIEQALHAPDLATSLTQAAPSLGAASLPDSAADTFAYRLYFVGETASGLPAADPAAALTAFHFVIEATGYGTRGAASTHVQSFKVLRPAGWTEGPANTGCDPADDDCVAPPYPAPLRTSWLEAEAE